MFHRRKPEEDVTYGGGVEIHKVVVAGMKEATKKQTKTPQGQEQAMQEIWRTKFLGIFQSGTLNWKDCVPASEEEGQRVASKYAIREMAHNWMKTPSLPTKLMTGWVDATRAQVKFVGPNPIYTPSLGPVYIAGGGHQARAVRMAMDMDEMCNQYMTTVQLPGVRVFAGKELTNTQKAAVSTSSFMFIQYLMLTLHVCYLVVDRRGWPEDGLEV